MGLSLLLTVTFTDPGDRPGRGEAGLSEHRRATNADFNGYELMKPKLESSFPATYANITS